MAIRVKNWEEFQHFKDRSPPWIKLYRKILDDPQWHKLDPEASKILVMLWLLASEDHGTIPSVETIAFRLRLPETQIKKALSKLSHWLALPDINAISTRHHEDTVDEPKNSATEVSVYQETETETETETEKSRDRDDGFSFFWDVYPNKAAKQNALKAWKKIPVSLHAHILNAVDMQKQSQAWLKDNGQFIPHAATWLNGKRWEDTDSQPLLNGSHWNTV